MSDDGLTASQVAVGLAVVTALMLVMWGAAEAALWVAGTVRNLL